MEVDKIPFLYAPEGATFIGGYGYNYHIIRYKDLDIMAGLAKPPCGAFAINTREDHKIADKIVKHNLCGDCAKLYPPRISLFETQEELDRRISLIKKS